MAIDCVTPGAPVGTATIPCHQALLGRQHWVFDLDGTLTLAVHDFAAIRRALEIPPGADILAHLDRLPPEQAREMHLRLERIEHELCGSAVAAQGAEELLSLLTRERCRCGILTRNTREAARLTLQQAGLDQFFEADCIIGRHQAPPKPDPGGLLQLAARWDTHPRELVMVGDYLYDLQCGRNSGAATVHVDPDARFAWQDLADLQVHTLHELQALRLALR